MAWKPEYNRSPRRNRALIRILGLMRLLKRTGREWTMSELADRFGVGPKTIKRDVRALKLAKWPVRTRRGIIGGREMTVRIKK